MPFLGIGTSDTGMSVFCSADGQKREGQDELYIEKRAKKGRT
ncbi:Hypothetical protein EUBELI_01533 [Lachnospira eligens ATCC 27750]|uniref:Uncharacterized protein n=1 Tax=Lachnospira eligens (strain ATCC 27750 / DSM 3376 / VPI C15-48 / C15-B4) TaxID=515620 RepID=C4Z2F0_LACE2|nr:Hypothetical protein EUBELI_01533 [[Eubacterium] eligens ATCC 27750]